jgi:lipopolysaccharide transport system ATP-binding protein
MKPAIRVEHLSKRYRIGIARGADYRTFRESVSETLSSPWRRLKDLSRWGDAGEVDRDEEPRDHFWALRDVSFEVRPGEAVGIIGRNGAGKSTLLKILSRITEPSSGRAEFRGRVGSLLEVGTGFHPELTGRENIFLNGSILGMGRREVDRVFDEIVAFSEIERFLDTPVKRYSSGMYVRLAFAVAAHLEPEILLVDEVLAVGDVAFQRKCLGKMQEVGRQGRTVFFVSHNLGSLQALCGRGILLRDGQVVDDAPIGDAINTYLRSIERAADRDLAGRTDRRGDGSARLTAIDVLDGDGLPSVLTTGRPARFVFHVDRVCPGLECSFTIYNQQGHPLAHLGSRAHGPEDDQKPDGQPSIECCFDEFLLLPGRYRLNVALASSGELVDHVEGATIFDVEQGEVRGRLARGTAGYGEIHLPHRWALPSSPVC